MAISDQDFLLHILNNLPKEYDVVLDGLESRLDETGDKALTLEIVCEKLSQRYVRIKKEVVDDDNDGREHERALFAKDWHPPQFKGTCHKCGKYGHKGSDCRDCAKNPSFQKMVDVGSVLRKDINCMLVRSSKQKELSLTKLI